jgi:hypothetical protein
MVSEGLLDYFYYGVWGYSAAGYFLLPIKNLLNTIVIVHREK